MNIGYKTTFIIPHKTENLFALGVGHVLLAESAIFAECELLLHFFLVALGVMRDPAARRAFQFHQSILDLSHTSLDYSLFTKLFHCT